MKRMTTSKVVLAMFCIVSFSPLSMVIPVSPSPSQPPDNPVCEVDYDWDINCKRVPECLESGNHTFFQCINTSPSTWMVRDNDEDYDYDYYEEAMAEFIEACCICSDVDLEECLNSPSPSISPSPPVSPSPSQSPTKISAPTVDCTCCDCTHTSGCNPDPHYYTWDNRFYDFQGGCDQYAVVNPILELQIATRPGGHFSAITQVSLFMKQSGQSFKAELGNLMSPINTIDSASGATVTTTYSDFFEMTKVHMIQFDGVDSSIKINESSDSFSIQVLGHGSIFTDSEGMFGSWNSGQARYRSGTVFDTSRDDYTKMITSIELARDWQVPVLDSKLLNPSPICDANWKCGDGYAFGCDETRRLQAQQAHPNCESTCDEIENDMLREFCETDVALTGDPTWACEENYLNIIVADADQCDFDNGGDDAVCVAEGYTCHFMGGTCVVGCVDTDSHVCLPGICSEKKKPKSTKAPKEPKAPKTTKAPKEPRVPKAGKRDRFLKKDEDVCSCLAPKVCPNAN